MNRLIDEDAHKLAQAVTQAINTTREKGELEKKNALSQLEQEKNSEIAKLNNANESELLRNKRWENDLQAKYYVFCKDVFEKLNRLHLSVERDIQHKVNPIERQTRAAYKETIDKMITFAGDCKHTKDFSKGCVYISSTIPDLKYHHNADCSALDSPILVTRSPVEIMGFSPCNCCRHTNAPDHDPIVEIGESRNITRYHVIHSSCLQSIALHVPLSNALDRNLSPCTRCTPPSHPPKVMF